jgi:hypothetical protein
VNGRAAKLIRRYVAVAGHEVGTVKQHKRWWRAMSAKTKTTARRMIRKIINERTK